MIIFVLVSWSLMRICYSSGGRCLSAEYTDRVGEIAKRHGLKLHVDGARIFNASVVIYRSSTLSQYITNH